MSAKTTFRVAAYRRVMRIEARDARARRLRALKAAEMARDDRRVRMFQAEAMAFADIAAFAAAKEKA